jgi:ATP-dependent DNA helicase RecG
MGLASDGAPGYEYMPRPPETLLQDMSESHRPDLSLADSVQYFKGIGPSRAELLAKLGIRTVSDLLFHLPRYYDDLSDVRPISKLTAGTLQTIQGEVVEVEGKTLPDGRRILSIVLADDKGKCVEGVWFNQLGMARQVRYGQKLAFSGKPRWYQDHWQMNHPRVQPLDEIDKPQSTVVAVYPLTENVRADQLQAYVRQALERFLSLVKEVLPPSVRNKRSLPEVGQALRQVHFPQTLPEALNARRRFVYEEFLVLQVGLALRRRELRDRRRAAMLPVDQAIDTHIRRLFPFSLTKDQDKAVAAICRDLAADRPMQRLLQADVGAGKTAVAVYALLLTVANKHQAALMAPTEVLARQHWHTIETYLAKSRVRRLLLTGSLTSAQRRQSLEDIRQGRIDLVIGTQALIQKDVQFQRLGLVIIDEQHKFGVLQRARMGEIGRGGDEAVKWKTCRDETPGLFPSAADATTSTVGQMADWQSAPRASTEPLSIVDPHYLVMTATPIPRTVALTLFGDLELSIIRQLPPGRQPVVTQWLTNTQRERIYEHLTKELRGGRQAFVVCPLVEESETLDLEAAEQTLAELREGPFREFRLGLLHGRMDDEAKDRVMSDFRAGKIDLLVATLVIEVGIDVPNATLMLILHAERFGLSQLHQLRGRVSRGQVAGECYLFAHTSTDDAKQRLQVMTRTSDGFALAEEDAKLRGLGEFFGPRQHGLGDFRFGDPLKDRALLEEAREDAIELIAEDPELNRPEHALLRTAVISRYGQTLNLASVG